MSQNDLYLEMAKRFLFLLIMSSVLAACRQSDSAEVFRQYLAETETTPDYAEVRSKLHDSIQSWIDRGLYELLFYPKVNWKIDDAVFFDKKKSKALLLILAQVKDSTGPEDYVKVVGAEKLAGRWEFYYAGYVVDICRRSDHQSRVYSLADRAAIGRREINDDGFVKCALGCRIDYGYIDSDVWFTDWQREWHKKFLRNGLPRHPVAKPGEMFF
jgi:hypothetical protein